ncbi:hypothetical protein LXL04_033036 [Taraxacum kok-saghyz]
MNIFVDDEDEESGCRRQLDGQGGLYAEEISGNAEILEIGEGTYPAQYSYQRNRNNNFEKTKSQQQQRTEEEIGCYEEVVSGSIVSLILLHLTVRNRDRVHAAETLSHTHKRNEKIKQEGTQGYYVVRIRYKSYIHGLQLDFLINSIRLQSTSYFDAHSFPYITHIYIGLKLLVFQASSSQEHAKLSPISLIAAAPPHQVLEGTVEAPTSSNSAVANPATDSSSVSTGLDTPPDPEIHRGSLTLSKHSKYPTGEHFPVLVFKTQRIFVTVPGTRPVLPLSQNLLTGLDFPTRSANILLAPEFMFAI